MNEKDKLAHCVGCRDNFYNRSDSRCWNLPTAKLKRRWETGTWTDPTTPGAFREIKVLSCFNAPGRHFSDSLPACAKEPIKLERKRSA